MGRSPTMLKIIEKISRIAHQDIPVLISGEHGTCKELVAKAIHENSPRQNGPFVSVNLAAIPIELAAAELVGSREKVSVDEPHRHGGKIAEADGGTLFVKEIFRSNSDLSDRLGNLIRDKEMRFNERETVRSDVRIIGATSGNVDKLAGKGQPLSRVIKACDGVHLRIPALRERKEDILPLVQYCMDEAAAKFHMEQKELSSEARDYLLAYAWPGNMRELEHLVTRATILSKGRRIEKRDLLMADIGSCSVKDFFEEKLKRYLEEMMKLESCNLYDTVLSEAERSLIAIVLQRTGGNQLKAAKILGITRNTLRTKIKAYHIHH